MKKIFLCFIVLGAIFSFVSTTTKASSLDYKYFSEIYMTKGKLLCNYTQKNYDEYYGSVKKKKMFGWRTFIVNDASDASFVSEKLCSFSNRGTTPIKYSLDTVAEEITKTSISSSGSIKYAFNSVSANKQFKNGLDVETKMEYTYNKTISFKESESTNIVVDPGTMCNIYITGNAKVTNGVAARYFFWIRKDLGGFEYFTITDIYPQVEIVKL